MSENTVNPRSITSHSSFATNLATNRSAQNSRIAALAHPNVALQDMQEEIAFALGEKMQFKNAEDEKVEERNAALLKEFARRVKQKKAITDKAQEPLQHKIENSIKEIAQHQGDGRVLRDEDEKNTPKNTSESTPWERLMNLTNDKAALFVALSALKEKSEASGNKVEAQQYQEVQERCAKECAPQIRAALNIGEEVQQFAKNNNLPAEQLLDAYQKTVADYRGILGAALTLTEKLGVENSATAAAFIRKTAAKEITMLQPSIAPEQLLHILAELKGLQVLATVTEQVASHRQAMAHSENISQKNDSSSKNPATTNTPSKATVAGEAKQKTTPARGIATLSNQDLVTGVFQSAVKPQAFQEKLDKPASSAYSDKPEGLIMHLQGLHKIFKNLPEYAFPDRLDKQRALLPLEIRLDSLIALEREESL